MGKSIEEHFCKGDVVIIPFPYTDLENFKLRPALIIAISNQNLNILMITTKTGRENEVFLERKDFQLGSLSNNPSFIRVDMIATINQKIVKSKVGKIKNDKLNEVIDKMVEFIKQPAVIEESKIKAVTRANKPSK